MCLTTRQPKPTKARKDILVYKVLGRGNAPPYFRDFKYSRGKLHTSELAEENPQEKIHRGLHSFNTRKDAEHEKEAGQRIVEMIIPKGSLYYSGVWGGPARASNKLFFPNLLKKKNVSKSKRRK